MGFRINVVALLFLIVADAIFTIVRPTTKDYEDTMNVDVLDYVFIAAHGVVVICQAVTIFIMFSNSIWFTAGLLGELLSIAKWTLFVWAVRFIFVAMPWVHRRFIGGLGDTPMTDGGYRFLYVTDLLLAVANWAALMYTAGCMTEKRMYSPYHKEFIPMPHVAYQHNVNQMNRAMMMNRGNGMMVNNMPPPSTSTATRPQLTESQQLELTQMRSSQQQQNNNDTTTIRNSGALPPPSAQNTTAPPMTNQNMGLGYDHAPSGSSAANNNNTSMAPPPGVG